MKNLFIFLLLIAGTISSVQGQNYEFDSLNLLLQNAPRDTNYVQLLIETAYQYYFTKLDSGLVSVKKALSLARTLQYKKGEADALNAYGMGLDFKGDYLGSVKAQLDAVQINHEMNDVRGEGVTFGLIGIQYIELGENRQALNYLLQANEIGKHMPFERGGSFVVGK